MKNIWGSVLRMAENRPNLWVCRKCGGNKGGPVPCPNGCDR